MRQADYCVGLFAGLPAPTGFVQGPSPVGAGKPAKKPTQPSLLNADQAHPACRTGQAHARRATAPHARRPWRRSCGWRPCG
ncbi:hypothetical protein FPB55_22235 [Pseudomonas sp. BJP69]|nr:hypothetical protein FPB55_22235 [Pseudomonas sp. BJP69]